MPEVIPKDSTDFKYEFEKPELQGELKQQPSDFQVKENLKFALRGEGQHLCLFIEKQLLNTLDAVKILARFFNVPEKDIGYFGMKDKLAITSQWFSVDLAKSHYDENYCESFDTQFSELLQSTLGFNLAGKKRQDDKEESSKIPHVKRMQIPLMKIISISRNHKKFKIGQLASNSFRVCIRDIRKVDTVKDLSIPLDKKIQQDLEKRLKDISTLGYPNYFGEQRFGRDNKNIELLKKHLKSDLSKRRALRSRLISTLRALIFNRYLSERIQEKTLRQYKLGDVLQFPDSRTLFTEINDNPEDSSDQSISVIQNRIDLGGVYITGPMLGFNAGKAERDSLVFESMISRKFRTYLPFLERHKVQSARRALITQPKNMTWQWLDNDLLLSFELPSGSFATSMIRELVNYRAQKASQAKP